VSMLRRKVKANLELYGMVKTSLGWREREVKNNFRYSERGQGQPWI